MTKNIMDLTILTFLFFDKRLRIKSEINSIINNNNIFLDLSLMHIDGVTLSKAVTFLMLLTIIILLSFPGECILNYLRHGTTSCLYFAQLMYIENRRKASWSGKNFTKSFDVRNTSSYSQSALKNFLSTLVQYWTFEMGLLIEAQNLIHYMF